MFSEDKFMWAMFMGLRPPHVKNGIRLEFKFNDIEDFYTACQTPDKEVWNEQQYKRHQQPNPEFVGLGLKKILESKYSYPPGIEKLEKIKEDLLMDGASTFKNKWDDVDGEDMSMERLYDEMPFMSKRVRRHGFLNGKFVKIYVNLTENGGVHHEDLINKTYTAVSLIDYLESMGYRTEVYAIINSSRVGHYKDQFVEQLYIEIPIKKWDESVNVGLLITTLSPWMFRYWDFLLETGHMNTFSGLGHAERHYKKSELGEIHINCGECLTKESSEEFINKIKNLYDQTTEENIY